MPTWSLRPADRRRRTARGVRAAVASLLLPGVGQLIVGCRRRGALLLTVTLLAGAAALWVGLTELTSELLGWLLQPAVLVGVFAANLVVLAFRLYATFDAYVVGARPPAEPALPRSGLRAAGVGIVVAVLAVVTALPHAALGYYTAATHGVVSTVFVAEVPTTEEVGSDHAEAQDRPEEPEPGTDAAPVAEREADPPPELEEPPLPPENPWLQARRITVALLGSDAGPGRGGDRIDSLLVLTVDTDSGDAAIFSVDRYLADFPLPPELAPVYEQHCRTGDGWRFLNALYRCGHERVPEEFAAVYPRADDPAAAAVADVLGRTLGIAVPHYAMVDMAGFVGIVDALGGVEIELAEPLRVRMSPAEPGEGRYTVDLPAGLQELDGREALAFVRFRDRAGGDADRMRRQRCLVTNVVQRADVPALLVGFPRLADAVETHVVTSIPLPRLPELLEVLPRIDPDRVVTVGFGPPDYRGWDHVPDLEAIQARVHEVLAEPDAWLAEDGVTDEGGDPSEVGGVICR